MARPELDVRRRLQEAAVELFRERGYDQTKAAEIAARIGVTERTFFRHSPDKREVLFDGQVVLMETLTASITNAPADMGAVDALFLAFRSVVPLLEANRPFSKPRQDVISVTPALQERELAKLEALSDALASTLKVRDIPDLQATLAARIGMVAFAQATLSWLADDEKNLADRIDQAEQALRGLL